MHIIIEGPDNVGKSTQIRYIKNYFNTVHFLTYSSGFVKQSSDKAYIAYSRRMMEVQYDTFEFNESINVSSICDRAHIGETVYSPIYRGYSGDFVFEYEKDIKNQYLIVYLDTPANLIKRDDGLSFSTELDKKQKEIDGFIRGFNMSKIKNKKIIYITGKNEHQVQNETISFIKEKYERTAATGANNER